MPPARFGISGASNAGKTTLITRLLPQFHAMGLAVAVIKHAHHGLDLPDPPKDSHRFHTAGAQAVAATGPDRTELILPPASHPESLCHTLSRCMPEIRLILVEGWKGHPMPRLEVWRNAVSAAPLLTPAEGLCAIVTSDPIATPLPVFSPASPHAIARWIAEQTGCHHGEAAQSHATESSPLPPQKKPGSL